MRMKLIIMNSNEHALTKKKIALCVEPKQNSAHASLPSLVKSKVIDYTHTHFMRPILLDVVALY